MSGENSRIASTKDKKVKKVSKKLSMIYMADMRTTTSRDFKTIAHVYSTKIARVCRWQLVEYNDIFFQ